jgi:hypothetical protein
MKRVLKEVWLALSNRADDLLDRSARRRSDISWGPHVWATVGVIVTAAAGYFDSAEKLFVGAFGGFVGTFRFLLLVVAQVGCWFVICSKQRKGSGILASDVSFQYSFAQPLRFGAKLGSLLLLLLVPTRFLAAKDDFVPLPRKFYGYLVDGKSGQPIRNASVRVATADGVDVTDGLWFSDTDGFYVVGTREPVKRSGHVLVSETTCPSRVRLNLRRIDQVGTKNDLPIFRHVLTCGE